MQNSDKNAEKQENKADSPWNPAEQSLATEIIHWREKVSSAKDMGIKSMAVAVVVLGIIVMVALTVNHLNNRDWLNYISQYDFISQDGEGINSINNGTQGDLLNGAESQGSEESK